MKAAFDSNGACFAANLTAVRNKFFTTGTPVFSGTQFASVVASSRRCNRSLGAGKAWRLAEQHTLAACPLHLLERGKTRPADKGSGRCLFRFSPPFRCARRAAQSFSYASTI